MVLPLFFLLLLGTSVSAQKPDTTHQQPNQLETLPTARPTAPAQSRPPAPPRQPTVVAPVPADTVKPRQATPGGGEKEEFDLLKKLFLAGSATFNFLPRQGPGSFFVVGATPTLGYKLHKYLVLGPGLGYSYIQMGAERGHGYGPKAFAQVFVYKNYLLHAENLWLKVVYYQKDPQGNSLRLGQTWLSGTLVGGGHRSMINERFGVDLIALWQVRSTNTGDIDNLRTPRIRAGLVYHLK